MHTNYIGVMSAYADMTPTRLNNDQHIRTIHVILARHCFRLPDDGLLREPKHVGAVFCVYTCIFNVF